MKTRTPTSKVSVSPAIEAEKLPPIPRAFSSDNDILAAALNLFDTRLLLKQFAGVPEERRRLIEQEQAWTGYWHRSLNKTAECLAIARACQQHRLSRVEREVLAVFVLKQLGLITGNLWQLSDVLQFLRLSNRQKVIMPRVLSRQGRLCRSGLVELQDQDAELFESSLTVNSDLMDELIGRSRGRNIGWTVRTEGELYEQMAVLSRALSKKSHAVHLAKLMDSTSEANRCARKAEKLLRELQATMDRHATWKVNRLQHEAGGKSKWIICLALLGKELGHLESDDAMFTGGGLAKAACLNLGSVSKEIRQLSPRGELLQKDIIRPCGRRAQFASDDASRLERTEFELSDKAIELLGLNNLKLARRSSRDVSVREPKIRLTQLVLSDQVRQALDMAISQMKNSQKLMVQWGLGRVFSYGGNPVLMFSGPPGTGKTAVAEGFAGELNKCILVADYSRIQNCYVGETEKRIVRTFREAERRDAVLFWDEADAMFFDRDSSHYAWEVRSINVLLQELERFQGVCILATNRKATLDKALQRRIALKIDFERPDQKQRKQIWRKLLPKKMPLSAEVNLDRLSQADLVGGEIKNVVLNAARLATKHGMEHVTMADFEQAIDIEKRGWTGGSRKRIGFDAD